MTRTIKGKLTLGLFLTISIFLFITFFITNKYEKVIDNYDTLTDNISYVEEILLVSDTLTENVVLRFANFDGVLEEDTIELLNELTITLDLLEESLENDGSRFIFDRLKNTIKHFDEDTRTYILYLNEDNIATASDYRESIIRTREAIVSIGSDLITNELSQMSVNRVTLSESLSKSRTQYMVLILVMTGFLIYSLWNINKGIVKNIKGLQDLFRAVGQGNLDYIAPIFKTSDEFDELMTDANKMKDNLRSEKEQGEKYLSDFKEAGNIFENSITNAPLPIMIHSEDGKVINLSDMWTKLTGYQKNDIPTIYEWTEKAYGQNKGEVFDFIKKLYKLTNVQHDGEFIVNTKDGRKLTWDFNSGYIGNLPDGRAVAMSVATDITERIERERENEILNEKVKTTRMLLESSLESFEDIIVLSVDRNYEYLYFNTIHKNSMKKLFEIEIEIGNNILDYVTEGNDRNKSKRNYDLALSGQNLTIIEDYGVNQRTIFESSYAPIYNSINDIIGVTVFARDITVKKMEQLALEESEEKYKLLSDKLPLGMIHYQVVFDKKSKKNRYQFIKVNKVFEELVGMRNSDLFGKNLVDVFPKTEQYWLDNFDEVVSSGNSITFEDFAVEVDGYMKLSVYTVKSDILAVVIEDVTDSRRKQNEILHISYHDSLTDLYNRRYYVDNLNKFDIPDNYPLTIVMSDINGLKLINDAFGHTAGDKLLISAANVISESCRETDLIARIGGDEFVMVMPNTNEIEADRIIVEINKKAQKITVESIQLSISFGFATKRENNQDIEEIFRSAEDLMYRVKLTEIPSMRSGAIETILNTLYEKDKNSEIHSRTVSDISEKIAIAYGMGRQEVNEVKTAGLLHDIGKIIIPISIITKQGKLTTDEYNLIKGHPEIGFRILNSTHDMRNISNIVLNHHERWDGLGYPRGIKAKDVPLPSRMIAIADAFDAMTSKRTYREILTNEEALNEIINNAGSQFDPELIKIFEEHFSEIIVE